MGVSDKEAIIEKNMNQNERVVIIMQWWDVNKMVLGSELLNIIIDRLRIMRLGNLKRYNLQVAPKNEKKNKK